MSDSAGGSFLLPPLALYIHIPWCVRKCPYCDFNSHAAGPTLPEEEYVDALLADLDIDVQHAHDRPLSSIFFGGGTPSLFSDRALGRLLEGVERRIAFAPDIEITLEANPGTFEQAKFKGYRSLGINRLSIGVQSFQEAKLKALGRIQRTWKTRLPKDYLDPATAFQAGERLLAADELPFEFLMNVLRLTEGSPAELFSQRTGLPLQQLEQARREAERQGLLQADETRLVATAKGQLFLNDLLQQFLA